MSIEERKKRLLSLSRNTPEEREHFRNERVKLREAIDSVRKTVVQIIQKIEKGI